MRGRVCLSLGRLLVLAFLLFAGGSVAAAAEEAADRRAIESNAQRWIAAFNERSAAALASLVTADVVVLDGGKQPRQGARAASDAWLRSAAFSGSTFASTTKEIVISGDFAWRVSSLSYRLAGGEAHQGQALEIWKRTSDGWKMHRQMSSHLVDITLRPVPSEPVLDRPTN